MAWRGVHLTQAARLSLADGQVVVGQADGEVRLPIEDVAWMVIDTPQVTLTSALIAAFMDNGVAIVTTDRAHMPSGMILPFHRHHRQAEIAALQAGLSAPLKKRLWQAIIQAKIENQAAVCAFGDRDPSSLLAMARLVRSGDPDNVEARAARHYWGRLFDDFVREDGADRRNMMLNYGYAVLRGALARALVAVGLLPVFGVNHASATNAFNLADDLLEPFRPFVDRLVLKMEKQQRQHDDEFTVEDRRRLAAVLLDEARLGVEKINLLVASERAAESLVRAMMAANPALLTLPRLGTGET